MKLFGPNLNVSKRLSWRPYLRQENVLVWGTIAAFVLSGALLVLDGYLFFTSVLQEGKRMPPIVKLDTVMADEIEEAIKILDEREKKFIEIFGAPL